VEWTVTHPNHISRPNHRQLKKNPTSNLSNLTKIRFLWRKWFNYSRN